MGAGLAGLSAARALAAEGVAFEVIEARDRVGGRTVNEPIGDGKIVEVGGQWVGPTQDRILALIPELGLETCPTCRGYGSTIPNPCSECDGDGRVRSSRNLTVKIPAGVSTGNRIHLAAQGEVGPGGGPAGDLYV